jgi:hypothetical protein
MEKGGSRPRPAVENECERADAGWAFRNIGGAKNGRPAFAILPKEVERSRCRAVRDLPVADTYYRLCSVTESGGNNSSTPGPADFVGSAGLWRGASESERTCSATAAFVRWSIHSI